jgi:hypothetical protein
MESFLKSVLNPSCEKYSLDIEKNKYKVDLKCKICNNMFNHGENVVLLSCMDFFHKECFDRFQFNHLNISKCPCCGLEIHDNKFKYFKITKKYFMLEESIDQLDSSIHSILLQDNYIHFILKSLLYHIFDIILTKESEGSISDILDSLKQTTYDKLEYIVYYIEKYKFTKRVTELLYRILELLNLHKTKMDNYKKLKDLIYHIIEILYIIDCSNPSLKIESENQYIQYINDIIYKFKDRSIILDKDAKICREVIRICCKSLIIYQDDKKLKNILEDINNFVDRVFNTFGEKKVFHLIPNFLKILNTAYIEKVNVLLIEKHNLISSELDLPSKIKKRKWDVIFVLEEIFSIIDKINDDIKALSDLHNSANQEIIKLFKSLEEYISDSIVKQFKITPLIFEKKVISDLTLKSDYFKLLDVLALWYIENKDSIMLIKGYSDEDIEQLKHDVIDIQAAQILFDISLSNFPNILTVKKFIFNIYKFIFIAPSYIKKEVMIILHECISSIKLYLENVTANRLDSSIINKCIEIIKLY